MTTPAVVPTERQAVVLAEVIRYFKFTEGMACSSTYLAQRLDMSREAVRCHISALWRKGWLKSSRSPVTPNRLQFRSVRR